MTMESCNYTLDLSNDDGASDDNEDEEWDSDQWQQQQQPESQGPGVDEVIVLPSASYVPDYTSSFNTTRGHQKWKVLTSRSVATLHQKKEMMKKVDSDFLSNISCLTGQTAIQTMIKSRDTAAVIARRILVVIAILQYEQLVCNSGRSSQFSPEAISFLELSTRLDMSMKESEQLVVIVAEKAKKPKITV